MLVVPATLRAGICIWLEEFQEIKIGASSTETMIVTLTMVFDGENSFMKVSRNIPILSDSLLAVLITKTRLLPPVSHPEKEYLSDQTLLNYVQYSINKSCFL
jgi:hypothetical protein